MNLFLSFSMTPAGLHSRQLFLFLCFQVFMAECIGPLLTYLLFYFRVPYIYSHKYGFTSSPHPVVRWVEKINFNYSAGGRLKVSNCRHEASLQTWVWSNLNWPSLKDVFGKYAYSLSSQDIDDKIHTPDWCQQPVSFALAYHKEWKQG